MHTYLKAVGFSGIETQADLEELIKKVLSQPDSRTVGVINEKCSIIEYRKDFSAGIGVAVRGEEDESGNFHYSHLFPYLRGEEVSTFEEVFIHKKVDTDAYTGMCDDARLGISLIFYLQNVAEFIEKDKEIPFPAPVPVKMSALAKSGTVILPTQKRVFTRIAAKLDQEIKNRAMEEARNGDREAMEWLTMNDIDKYAVVSERIKKEDLFSIVDTTFIPFGSESDVYNVLANILSAKQLFNTETGERIWLLRLNCNDLIFDACINTKDLLGEPFPGMRFRGTIWMQGIAEFENTIKK